MLLLNSLKKSYFYHEQINLKPNKQATNLVSAAKRHNALFFLIPAP